VISGGAYRLRIGADLIHIQFPPNSANKNPLEVFNAIERNWNQGGLEKLKTG
jgi:hypothetical protein